MEKKRAISITFLMLASLFGICVLCSVLNIHQLTNPDLDFVDTTTYGNVSAVIEPTDLDALHIRSQKIVDDWSKGAYLYGIYASTSYPDTTNITRIDLSFLKVNRLDLYPRQWNASVTYDLEQDSTRLWIMKEESDPPPPLRKAIRLSKLSIGTAQALQIANEIIADRQEPVDISMYLYDYEWHISYGDKSSMYKAGYPIVRINALTGEIQQEKSPFDD